MEWNGSDPNPEEVEATNSVVDDGYPDEIALPKAPFEERDFLIFDRAEDWNEPVAPNAKQNKLSYMVDYFMMARKRQVVNTFIKDRMATEAAVFGANVPEGFRSLAKQLGVRKIQTVVRHKCDKCDYAWLGPVDPADLKLDDKCPDCGNARYMKTATGIKPVSIFWYFGLSHALAMLHCNPKFQAVYKKNVDLSINSYRNSSDGKRLNESTGGEAFGSNNALYVLFADAFKPNDTATQGVTGCIGMKLCTSLSIY